MNQWINLFSFMFNRQIQLNFKRKFIALLPMTNRPNLFAD